MRLIVGLGNPGEKYKNNRHNTGFILLDEIINRWREDSKLKCQLSKLDNEIFIKPQTFMNNSGESVLKVKNFYKIDISNIYIIHDDVDLPFGVIKKQFGSGSAGHKGVEDIIHRLGTKDFWRIRVGTGRPENKNIDIEDWVLTNFSDDELKVIKKITPSV